MLIDLPKNIICFDVENNGLYGEPFCVGAVVVDPNGKVLDQLFIRTNFRKYIDAWVAKNVVPAIQNEPVTHMNYVQVANCFLDWLFDSMVEHEAEIFADWALPVDSDFLSGCLKIRRGSGPIILNEVSTVLRIAGVDTDVSREEFVADEIIGRAPKKHHPLWDAEVSARAVQKAFRMLRSRYVEEKKIAEESSGSAENPIAGSEKTTQTRTSLGAPGSGGRDHGPGDLFDYAARNRGNGTFVAGHLADDRSYRK